MDDLVEAPNGKNAEDLNACTPGGSTYNLLRLQKEERRYGSMTQEVGSELEESPEQKDFRHVQGKKRKVQNLQLCHRHGRGASDPD